MLGARGIWLGLLVVALLGLGWFLLRGGERGRTRNAPASAPGSQETTSTPAAPLAEPAASPATSDAPSRASISEPAAERAQLAGAAPLREVELVEAGTGRPVPGAEAWIFPGMSYWNALKFEEMVKDRAQERSDERGVVRFAGGDEGEVLVLAKTAELCGGGTLAAPRPGGARARVELHPDWDVTVEAVHADERPAPGIPVRCMIDTIDDRERADFETGEDGRVVLRHFGAKCTGANTRSVELGLSVPAVERIVRRYESSALPRDLVRFRLPPGGSLDVRVLDFQEQPVVDDTDVQLTLIWPGEAREISPFRHQERESLQRATHAGLVSFPWIALGAEIQLQASRPGSRVGHKEYLPGPRSPGEHLEHTWVLGLDHPLLEFRAVDGEGRPLTETILAQRLFLRSGWRVDQQEPEATTDREGVFHLELANEFKEGDLRRLTATARGGSIGVMVDLAREFPPGLVPMGDLFFREAPIAVAGSVVDDAGAALEGAEITLQVPVMESTDETALESGKPWFWNELETHPKSDERGAFVVRAFLVEKKLRLSASKASLRSAVLELPTGSLGVEVELRNVGTLAGRLLLDPGIPPEKLELRYAALEPGQASPQRWEWEHHATPRTDGTFELEELLPGTYVVEAAIESQESLSTVPDVFVRGGEENRDPRLDPLDVRGKLRFFTLTLVAPEPHGSLASNLAYWGEGSTERSYAWSEDSPMRVLTTLDSFEGRLVCAGFRTVALTDVDGDREIHLERALSVRLALPTAITLPAPPVFVKAALAPDGDDSMLDWGGDAFDDAHEITCLAPGSGRMKVCWIVERRSGGGASASTLEVEPEQFVEVLEAEGQRFELSLTSETLSKALAAGGW